jgi:DNA repair photolyase
MPEVLRQELGKSSWARERVAIGTATDAYQPCEGRYRLTRWCLEALLEHHTPVSIVTKSTLIFRDLDLLTELCSLEVWSSCRWCCTSRRSRSLDVMI